MIPGDPARVMAGTDADAAGLEEIREKYGLHDPIPLQYLRWVGLGTALAAVLMRQTRTAMIEVLSADYIRTARSKGLAGFAVVVRHALRNGLIPVVTVLGLQMGALMGGAVVTESIFVLPGFGRLIVEAVFTRDYPVVQGVVLITASSYVLINLLVDVSYTVL